MDRTIKAKLNIITSLFSQFVVLACGLVVPRLMISTFGSEAYGATASITQFLAYITLLEGGIGGVARAALYKPLANKNDYKISAVVSEVRRFFKIIGYIFLVYVIFLALTYKYMSNVECFDYISTFFLVIVISISTFGQYFIGISYSVLLQADQKTYVTQIVSIITNLLNALLIIILIKLNFNLIIVKLFSSCVFILRPIMMMFYVKRKYRLINVAEDNNVYLSQKWNGLSQHIAYFLHSNTDIAVLTFFSNLSMVSVYSVYNMIISNLQNLTISFVAGMEALFGNMLANKEYVELQKIFGYYETLISFVTIVLFSTTCVLIVPFIEIYTHGIHDANYIQPIFALVLLLSSVIYCFRMPYHSMTIAAGHFKETQMAAYGEAVINLIISVVLVIQLDLVGVAIGTLVASSFRFVYYALYLSNNIFERPFNLFLKRLGVNLFNISIIVFIGQCAITNISIINYLNWIISGCVVMLIFMIITAIIQYIFYKDELILIIKKLYKVRDIK